QRAFCGIQIINRTEVRRYPKQEKPPHPIGHELTHCKSPRLPISKRLQERHFFTYRRLICRRRRLCFHIVLLNISQLSSIDFGVLMRPFVHKKPEAHPDESQCPDNDK